MKVILFILTIGLFSCASHHSVTGPKKMRHISPAPHLVHFSLENQQTLNLSSDQIKFLENIEKDLHPKGMKFAKAIMKNEKKIKQQSISKTSYKEIMLTYSDIENSRRGLAKLKIKAALRLKKQLTKGQWQKLKTAYAQNYEQDLSNKMVMMKHVNPVPNYMKLIKMNQELELSKDQQAKINQWQKDKHTIMMNYAKKVVKK
jgi:hypothetical protein